MKHESILTKEQQKNRLAEAFQKIESKTNTEREYGERYKSFLETLLGFLPQEEKRALLENPIDFVSQTYLFRGLSRKKMVQLLEKGSMEPEPGAYGSRAVFTTDSPYAALEFSGKDGALALLARANIEHLSPKKHIEDTASPLFQKQILEYIQSLPESEQKEALYTAINRWDTAEPHVYGHPWKTVSLRKTQPLHAVTAILFQTNEGVESADPNTREGEEKLYEHFGVPADMQTTSP